jgi:hypothetical protein
MSLSYVFKGYKNLSKDEKELFLKKVEDQKYNEINKNISRRVKQVIEENDLNGKDLFPRFSFTNISSSSTSSSIFLKERYKIPEVLVTNNRWKK